MRPIKIAAIALMALSASARAAEQDNGVVFEPGIRQIVLALDDRSTTPPKQAEAAPAASTDVTLIEAPPLPRPRPPSLQVARDDPTALISAFRRQHGEGPVAVNAVLTRLAQEQANAMAARSTLDHDVLAPFSSRLDRKGFSRAAENIAYGHADFPNTLKQWMNSSGHRVNLLMRGAKVVGVARASNGRQTYWAMIIGSETPKDRGGSAKVRRRSGPFESIFTIR